MTTLTTQQVLYTAIGKYKERARILKWLSMLLTNLEDGDDGNYLIKSRMILQIASNIAPAIQQHNESIWEASERYKEAAELIELIIGVGKQTTMERAIAYIQNSNIAFVAEMLQSLAD